MSGIEEPGMGDDDKGDSDGTRGGGVLAVRGEGVLTTYADVRREEALARRKGWHGEEMPTGMSLGRMATDTEPGRYVWRDPAGGAMEMVYVPPRAFPRMLESLARRGETWDYGAITAGYYAGVYPCTVGEFRRFVQATGYVTEAERDGDRWTWREPGFSWHGPDIGLPRDDHHPVVCVSWNDAQAYCGWSDLRFLSEGEWEYAARGAEGRTYPWGEEAPGPHLLNAAGGELRRFLASHGVTDCDVMYEGDDGWPTTSPVGSYPLGVTPDTGLYDLAGNVREWTESTYSPGDETLRVLRGGSWSFNVPSWVRASDRGGGGPAVRGVFIGFRCARGVMSNSR